MTFSARATSPTTSQTQRPLVRAPQQSVIAPMTRIFEVAALRADGKLHIAQHKVPNGALFDAAFCAFARGSLMATPKGHIAVEDLQPGDELNTSIDGPAKVMWIGSSTFVPADPTHRMPLIRIMADTFGVGRPVSFLTVGASARLLKTPQHMRGVRDGDKPIFTPAREFVDGVNVIEVCPPTPVRMFHVCLSRHAVINVGGMEMETFHPDSSSIRAASFLTRNMFLSMFPHIANSSDFGPLVHNRSAELNDVASG